MCRVKQMPVDEFAGRILRPGNRFLGAESQKQKEPSRTVKTRTTLSTLFCAIALSVPARILNSPHHFRPPAPGSVFRRNRPSPTRWTGASSPPEPR